MISKGKVIRPYIGIYLQPADQSIADYLNVENKGIVVVAVEPGSPAEKLVWQILMWITSINDKAVNNYDELQEILKGHKVGDTIVLKYTGKPNQ